MFSAAIKTDNVSSSANYVEDVFSTYLYSGTDSAITINNGIDLSTKGGLVWIKGRNQVVGNRLWDTVRGGAFQLGSQDTDAQAANAGTITFNTNGFSTQSALENSNNRSGYNYVSWTFREQAKFFDIVTYTGNGANNRQISHNLGSAPGCIILKRTDGTGEWWTYHRSLGDVGGFSYDLQLNTTSNRTAYQIFGTGATQTSTYFTLGTVFAAEMNGNGANYVAYLFAHDAGGFGLTGTDNVISCGSYTTNGSGVITSPVNLGYEPQWILSKRVDSTGNWRMLDVMRGDGSADGNISNQYYLYSNLSNAESGPTYGEPAPTATGFTVTASTANSTYVYIAIRRGPMKTPTTGTSVYNAIARAGTSAAATVTGVGFPPDLLISKIRTSTVGANWSDRLRGSTANLNSSSTDAEAISANRVTALGQDGFSLGTASEVNTSGFTYINWNFRRAPGFFDEVCYTGTGSATTFNHNLTVVPEMMIMKRRSGLAGWPVYHVAYGASSGPALNQTNATWWGGTSNLNSTAPTSTVFTVGTDTDTNLSGSTYVAYLFATCAGVSKVGSYTGTGALQTVDCGFAAGARFVLIKRKDATGDWYVWDSARGISSSDDPYLLLNSTAAEVTNTNYVDTDSTGFKVTAAAPAAINANGGTFIFLAVA